MNGKVRSTIWVNIADEEGAIKEKALADEKVVKFTEGKAVQKVIVIKGKIVNIVVK